MPKPRTGPFKTLREITIQDFHGGSRTAYPSFILPAGLRCRPISEGATTGKFFLTELPTEVFPRGSFLRHDAEYYGIVIEPGDVEDLTPKVPDWFTTKPLTPEAVQLFRDTQMAPYATAQKNEKLLTLYTHFNGAYSVVHGQETVFGPTEDLQATLDAFTDFYRS